MVKKVQDADSDQSMTSAPQEGKSFDLYIVQYIVRALMMLIAFAWALMNLDAVLRFLNSMFALVSPFLIGGAIAFLMNIMLRPLERLWRSVFRKAPAKLIRPVCLTLSAVLMLGILFAVVFMMIPSLRESGNEFIRNIPAYVEEIGQWWMEVSRFAAKYNVILPEYAIDSDLLIEKITAWMDIEGSGLISVTWGAATSILSILVDAVLAFVFAIYLLAKKENVAVHLKTHPDGASVPKGAATAEHRIADEPHLYELCQRPADGGDHHRRTLFCRHVDAGHSICRGGFNVCCGYRVGANLWRMAWRRFWRISDSAGRACQGSMVCRLSAGFAAGRGQSDLPKGCRQIRRSSGAARFDGGHDWRRGIRRHGHALQRSGLRGAVQPLFGVYEEIRSLVSASIVKPVHRSKILLVFPGVPKGQQPLGTLTLLARSSVLYLCEKKTH